MIVEGVLPILKPVNYTSHDVVAVMRGILGLKRVGHTGTLDPMVSGVLPICLGRATRMAEYIQELPKAYEAVLKLGLATDTEDMGGEIVARATHTSVTKEEIERTIASFIGHIQQVPPMYSAVKVQGKRLYELARKGLEIERKPRPVTIHSIEIIHMSLDQPYPEVKFKVLCSKGTYIRTLCVDIGRALGLPALMSDLVRTATGNIQLEHCLTLQDVERLKQDGSLAERVIPLDEAVGHIPAYTVDDGGVGPALQGQKISLSRLTPVSLHQSTSMPLPMEVSDVIRLYSPAHYFLGMFQKDNQQDVLRAVKVFGNISEALEDRS